MEKCKHEFEYKIWCDYFGEFYIERKCKKCFEDKDKEIDISEIPQDILKQIFDRE